ncbi:MAG: ribonuclease J [Candidatus Nomurabacteria bacterium]|nr:ribonuclease J [Candidatus Nomurabacteria bacterium]
MNNDKKPKTNIDGLIDQLTGRTTPQSNAKTPSTSPSGNKPAFKKRSPQQKRTPHYAKKPTTVGQPSASKNAGGKPHPARRTGGSPYKKNTFPRVRRPRVAPAPRDKRVATPEELKNKIAHIPALADGNIRVIPICGVEWITTNMTAIEYNNEIIVVDAGFGFPNPDQPGVNYTIPDVTYLEINKHKIKALVITHGHLDHIGAIQHVIEKLGNPPIYSREFGALLIKKRMEEFSWLPELNIITVEKSNEYIKITENLKVKFFGLTHSIPDSTGVIIQTPHGGIISTGDVRVENIDGVPVAEEVEQYKFLKDENIILLTMDSTGIITPGWSPSEQTVRETLDDIIKNTKEGRLFIATFASQVERLISFFESAKRYDKKIVIEGRSMKTNMAIAKQLDLTEFDHVIDPSEAGNYPDNKIVYLVTGGQGERYSFLDRVSRDDHRDVKLRSSDTVVLSSSVVPGNDFSVAQLKDRLFRSSSKIITHADNTVHASGHGKREELKWIHQQIPYKFFMPVHGEHHMLRIHAEMAQKELMVPKENIVVPDNGSIIELRNNGKEMVILKEKSPADIIIVDGTYVGPQHQVVIDDRQTLSENGMFIVVVSMNARTKKLKKSPDIISRGLVYLRGSQDLLNEARILVTQTAEQVAKKSDKLDFDELKKTIAHKVQKFLMQKTAKEPIVIPVVIGF